MTDNETYTQDELSLRDLYLVLRRGLPVILLSALLVGGATFLVSSLLPKVYEAQSTTLVATPPVQVQSTQNLTFRPPNEVSFEAYATLAESRPVREATLAAGAATGTNGSSSSFDGRVERLIGPQNANQQGPLSVNHSVRDTSPERAAALANAWAASTLDAVKTSLLASLEPVRAATEAEIAQRQDALSEVETRYEAFQRQDEGETLAALLQRLTGLISDSEARRDTLARDFAATRARVDLLSQPGAPTGASANAGGLAALLELLSRDESGGTREPQTERRAKLATILRLQPDNSLTGNVVALLNETDLRDAVVDLASISAEQDRLEAQLTGYQQQVNTLLGRIAALDLERGRLERELSNAQQAYSDVVALEPIITYVTTITPSNARVLNEASVPSQPVAPRRTLNTALGVVLASILATLFVFLREAVRAPQRVRTDSLHRDV